MTHGSLEASLAQAGEATAHPVAAVAEHAPLVVYIMGDGRSGSTVTGIVLGNHPSISSNGELHKWARYKGHPKEDNDKDSILSWEMLE